MSEEGNLGVEEETQEGQPQSTPEDQKHNDDSQEASEDSATKRNDAEYNWAEMRRQREKDRLELEELRNAVKNLSTPPQEEKEEDFGFEDDDLLEGRHLKQLKRELQQLKSELKQKEKSSIPERLQSKFPDFNEVMTVENLKYLEKEEPELAENLAQIPDDFKRAVGAYRLLKRLTSSTQPGAEEKKKVEANSKKPVSVNSVTQSSAIGNAHLFENGLSKSQIWKEMQECMKRA